LSRQIRATFDGTDMADLARMRLKREGIVIESFDIRPVDRKSDNGDGDIDVILNLIAQNGLTTDSFWMGSSLMQPYGGVLLGTNTDTFESRTRYDDIYSNDVDLIVTVHDDQADKAEDILRSCHGYGIRIK